MPAYVVSSGVSVLPALCLHRSQPRLSKPHGVGRRALQTLYLPQCQRGRLALNRSALPKLRRLSPLPATGSAAFELPSQQEVRQKAAARVKSAVPRPADLPPPPKSTSLLHVLPYLTKLAVSDAQLYWRLGLAFVLMVASKAAGRKAAQGNAQDVEHALLSSRAAHRCKCKRCAGLEARVHSKVLKKEFCRSHGASLFQEGS